MEGHKGRGSIANLGAAWLDEAHMHRRAFIGWIAAGLTTTSSAPRAQRSATPLIGFLHGQSQEEYASHVVAFRQGLRQTGYVDGENVAIEFRWANGRSDRLSAMAAELVQRNVVLIAVGGGSAARLAAKAATTAVPIVFMSAADPVREGLVASLSRPGGNITGIAVPSVILDVKRLQLANELLPSGAAIAVLTNPAGSGTEVQLREMHEAAHAMGRKIHAVSAATDHEIDMAFAGLAALDAKGLLISADPLFNRRRRKIVELTLRHKIPSISEWREFAEAGGLMSYGSDLGNGYREMGVWAGRILNGAKAAELPVVQASKFQLVVNMSTAKKLGVTVPQSVLLRADEVLQ